MNSRINTKVKRSSSCLSNCKGLLGHAIKDTLAYQIAVCMRQDHCVKKSVYSHFILIGNWPQRCVGVNDFSASPSEDCVPHVFCPVFCAPPPQWVDYSRKKFRAAFINGNFHVGEVQITNLNFTSFILLLSRIQLGRTTVLN